MFVVWLGLILPPPAVHEQGVREFWGWTGGVRGNNWMDKPLLGCLPVGKAGCVLDLSAFPLEQV